MMSVMRSARRRFKRIVRPFLTDTLRRRYVNMRARHPKYWTGSSEEIFSAIYQDGVWGSGGDFYSGEGSHDPKVVGPYVEAVTRFLRGLATSPDVVDLGCGDFAIGGALRPSCGGYVACDVVPSLIERNRRKFADREVSFKVLDLVEDALPDGDVALIRQVLQHLSNAQIARILPKLAKYKYVIITEHLPKGTFAPNLDKPAGPGIRSALSSAVKLDAPPFSLRAERHETLCVAPDRIGAIETVLWTGPIAG